MVTYLDNCWSLDRRPSAKDCPLSARYSPQRIDDWSRGYAGHFAFPDPIAGCGEVLPVHGLLEVVGYAGMSNVLADEKHQQVLALGRLGWSLRRIEQATTVRRETASAYLKAAGILVRGRGRPGVGPPKPAISGEVSTDLGTAPKPKSP